MPIKGMIQKFGRIIGMPERDPRMDQITSQDLGLPSGMSTRWADPQKKKFLKERPNWQPNKQTFKGTAGGAWGGGGAGESWGNGDYMVQDSTFIRPAIFMDRSFNTAFKEARQRGDSTFMFNGQEKHTRVGNNPNNVAAGERMREQLFVPSDSTYLYDVNNRISQSPIQSKNDTILMPSRTMEEAAVTRFALEKKRFGGILTKGNTIITNILNKYK